MIEEVVAHVRFKRSERTFGTEVRMKMLVRKVGIHWTWKITDWFGADIGSGGGLHTQKEARDAANVRKSEYRSDMKNRRVKMQDAVTSESNKRRYNQMAKSQRKPRIIAFPPSNNSYIPTWMAA